MNASFAARWVGMIALSILASTASGCATYGVSTMLDGIETVQYVPLASVDRIAVARVHQHVQLRLDLLLEDGTRHVHEHLVDASGKLAEAPPAPPVGPDTNDPDTNDPDTNGHAHANDRDTPIRPTTRAPHGASSPSVVLPCLVVQGPSLPTFVKVGMLAHAVDDGGHIAATPHAVTAGELRTHTFVVLRPRGDREGLAGWVHLAPERGRASLAPFPLLEEGRVPYPFNFRTPGTRSAWRTTGKVALGALLYPPAAVIDVALAWAFVL